MKVLVICDDRWHPAETARAGLAPLAHAGYEFDFLEDATDWSAEDMADYPVVLFTKSNNVTATNVDHWMTDEVEQAFVDYVEAGGGLLVVHSGTAEYRDTQTLRPLMGGVFTHHPQQCPVTVEPLADHPLTVGSESFTLVDEHYFMEMADVEVDHFLTTTSEHGEQPAGWTRQVGNGRVCVLTPGHNVEVWLDPPYQTLLQNGLLWCAQTEQA